MPDKKLEEPFEHNGHMYPRYHPPEEDKLLKQMSGVESRFIQTCKARKWDPKTFYIDYHTMRDALIRTDQRKLHYLMYHGMEMNELKEIAVFCYWLIRHKPITRCAGGPSNINEQIALEWLLDAVYNHKKRKYGYFAGLPEKAEKDLLYALTYRVASYDELTMYLELLSV